MARNEPPRWAAWVIGRLVPSTLREAVLGDLAERFARWVVEDGPSAARRRYWREGWAAVRALGALSNEPTSLTPPRWPWDGLGRDVGFAVRLHARRPLAAALVVATLGIAIAGSTAIFSVLKPALLDALPYPNGDRLVLVWEREDGGATSNIGFATMVDIRDRSATLDRAAAISWWQPTWLGRGEPVRLTGARVSASYFGMLGVVPALGRDFLPSDDQPGVGRVAIISHRLWRERFGANHQAIGQSISLDGNPVLVVGVLPDGFENLLQEGTEIFGPLRYEISAGNACRSCRHLRMMGRLAEGQTVGSAQAEIDQLARALATEYPKDYRPDGMLLEPLRDTVTKASRTALWILFAAVGLVLGIACANVANLLLGQAAQRRHEFAVRMALGSGRDRLVRQMLIEGAMLGLAGAVVGLGLTAAGFGPIRSLASGVPRAEAVGLDWGVFGFAALVGLVAGVGIALAPARLSLAGASDGLRQSGRISRRIGPRRVLVATEVALATVLVIGALMLVRSVGRILAVDPGFRVEGLLTANLQTAGQSFQTSADVWRYYAAVRTAVEQVPGATAVTLTSNLPLGGGFDFYGVRAASLLEVNPDAAVSASRAAVTPGYFEVMGIALLEGRTFTAADRDGAPRVAVVNRHFAETQFPGRSALGERIRIGGGDDDNPIWWTVVGVVANVSHQRLDEPPGPQVFTPNEHWRWGDDMTLVVRTTGDPAALAEAVQRAIRSVHPDPTIAMVVPMTQLIGQQLAARRLVLRLFGGFGAVALLLAAIGVYGVLASGVTERNRELGIRAAVGASRQALWRSILTEALGMGGLGLGLGLGLAAALSTVLARQLSAIEPAEPVVYLAAAVLLAGTIIVAAWAPARRAAAVDPGVVLRD